MKEKSLDIELVAPTQDELERLIEDSSTLGFRHFSVAPGALPPAFVFASALARFRAGESWFWSAPRFFCLSGENVIVGAGSFKNSPRAGGVEIGCGVADSYRGRNFATRGIELLVAEGFTEPGVTAITAETAVWNAASQRVLEKSHFSRIGTRMDPEDGQLIIWRRGRVAS